MIGCIEFADGLEPRHVGMINSKQNQQNHRCRWNDRYIEFADRLEPRHVGAASWCSRRAPQRMGEHVLELSVCMHYNLLGRNAHSHIAIYVNILLFIYINIFLGCNTYKHIFFCIQPVGL